MSDLPIRKVISGAVSVLALWLSFALLFGAARWMCALPWSQQCVLNFFSWFEAIVLFTWVEEPEQIVGSLLAVGAASVSVFFLHRQIQQTERHEHDRYQRRLRAIRAATPLTLSKICAYSTELAKGWMDVPDRNQTGGASTKIGATVQPAFPTLDPGLVKDLCDLIEATSEKDAAPFIALLNMLQVSSARARDFIANGPNMTMQRIYCRSEALEAAEIYARASALFDPIRDDHLLATTKPSARQVSDALKSMQIYDSQLVSALTARFARATRGQSEDETAPPRSPASR